MWHKEAVIYKVIISHYTGILTLYKRGGKNITITSYYMMHPNTCYDLNNKHIVKLSLFKSKTIFCFVISLLKSKTTQLYMYTTTLTFTSRLRKPPSCAAVTRGEGSNHSQDLPRRLRSVLTDDTVTEPEHRAKINTLSLHQLTSTSGKYCSLSGTRKARHEGSYIEVTVRQRRTKANRDLP